MTIDELLKQVWGYDAFRPMQREIIESVLAGHDVLALLPTGGGKSVCFQIPALAQPGLCLVISPLIALMKDQVENLRKRGIHAEAVYSGMSYRQIDHTLDACIYGDVKFLYVSPERLRTELFRVRAKQMKINLIAVDEAHCVSAWGYDFRPPYLQIAEFRELFPKLPLLALTATATREVKADIVQKLAMRNERIFQQSFARPNLSYSIITTEDKEVRLQKILTNVPGTSVVYARSRRRTQAIANELSRRGIPATFYHAGLSASDRAMRQEAWLKGRIRVMVATNAFGMGIDKPDVRTVIHLDLPDTLEAYFQEAGRGGRDGEKAYAVALVAPGDGKELVKQVEQQYPELDFVRRVYQCLANYFRLAIGAGEGSSYDFDLNDFQSTFGLATTETYYALKILESEGFIQMSESYHNPSKLHFTVNSRELYEFQVRNERFDGFTKLLLRMYGGALFTEYLIISESAIAKAYLVPEAEVRTLLYRLEELNVIEYDPQKTKPQLTFITARYDAAGLPLSVRAIAARRDRDLSKVQAMIAYVGNTTRCRTQLLLEYFDEPTDYECGICDTCVARKKARQTAGSMTQEKQRIVDALASGPITIQQLVARLAPKNENAFLLLVRELVSEEVMAYDALGNLYLR
ncbi:RecQ family ATP-dependent DNA helicase [Siphonobacter sp.]|uniref:RecQ family ATP-dependent DNA helicase n=1 Tax=Siphonobacter sp. TaxID=1869184 RepID=UPI003B3AF1B9